MPHGPFGVTCCMASTITVLNGQYDLCERGPLFGYLFNGATSRSDGVLAEVLGGTLCRGCPPPSVALFWHALLPGTAGEAVAQEGFAQLEVALPSSLTHVAMIGSRQ